MLILINKILNLHNQFNQKDQFKIALEIGIVQISKQKIPKSFIRMDLGVLRVENIEPSVAAYPSSNSSGWIFDIDRWRMIEKNKLNLLSKYHNKYCVPAIKLKLE